MVGQHGGDFLSDTASAFNLYMEGYFLDGKPLYRSFRVNVTSFHKKNDQITSQRGMTSYGYAGGQNVTDKKQNWWFLA